MLDGRHPHRPSFKRSTDRRDGQMTTKRRCYKPPNKCHFQSRGLLVAFGGLSPQRSSCQVIRRQLAKRCPLVQPATGTGWSPKGRRNASPQLYGSKHFEICSPLLKMNRKTNKQHKQKTKNSKNTKPNKSRAENHWPAVQRSNEKPHTPALSGQSVRSQDSQHQLFPTCKIPKPKGETGVSGFPHTKVANYCWFPLKLPQKDNLEEPPEANGIVG